MSAAAAELLADLQLRGVTIQAHDDKLRVSPKGSLTPAEQAVVRQHKSELLRLLTQPTTPAPSAPVAGTMPPAQVGPARASDWPDVLNEMLGGYMRTIVPFTACSICATGTWCSYAEIPLCRKCAQTRGAAVTAYRAALWRCWMLTAAGPQADGEDCRSAIDGVVRLADEVGEPIANRLRHGWETEWFRQSGRCPRCGEAETHP
jgi:TubC N-terminal docking domain